MKRKRTRLKKEKRDHFSFAGEYKKSFDFLKSSKDYIYIAILIFAIFVVLGFFFEDLVNLIFKVFFGTDLNQKILDHIKNILLQTEGMSQGELTGYIFFNNLQSSLLGIFFGFFFGIFPLFATIVNGYLLGFVGILSVRIEGIFVLWRLLPHGIFELPAIFISFGLGLRFGTLFLKPDKKMPAKEFLKNILRVVLLIIFPLLVIAAVLEGFLIFFT